MTTTKYAAQPSAPDIKAFRAKVGQLTVENGFTAGALIRAGMLSAPSAAAPVGPKGQ